MEPPGLDLVFPRPMIIEALIATIPIAVVLVLMLVARWSAVRAGIAGLVAAMVIAVTFFPFESVEQGLVVGVTGAFAEAIWTALTILWIILPALAIYRLQVETGAVDSLRTGLTRLSSDPRLTALVVAWFFALLLEGAAGFGTSAALAAPFLIAIGMAPVPAVTAAMIGHVLGVTFGAVGTPVVPMVAASGLDPLDVSSSMAVQASIVGWIVPVVAAWLIARAYTDLATAGHRRTRGPGPRRRGGVPGAVPAHGHVRGTGAAHARGRHRRRRRLHPRHPASLRRSTGCG